MKTRVRPPSSEKGSALFLAIVLGMMLAAIASAALLAGHTETLIAANFRQGREALYVAEGAMARALKDLSDMPDWTPVLAGVATSSFQDGPASGGTLLPGGGTVVLCCDASSLTAEVQLRAYGGADWGPHTPQWQIYAWGPAARWLGEDRIQSVFYTVAWVSDDAGDGDGNPAADSNGTVAVTAVALGSVGARRAAVALIQRAVNAQGQPNGVRILSWREVRW